MSVFDGTICRSGMSSPVVGSRYWIKLWWESSVSSSTRMPVARSTSTMAKAQKAWSSSRPRSRRCPVTGSSASTLAVADRRGTTRTNVCPAAVNVSPGAASRAADSTAAASLRRLAGAHSGTMPEMEFLARKLRESGVDAVAARP